MLRLGHGFRNGSLGITQPNRVPSERSLSPNRDDAIISLKSLFDDVSIQIKDKSNVDDSVLAVRDSVHYVLNRLINGASFDDGGTESGYGKILYKELAESYVDISTYNIQADVDGDMVTFECEVVRQGDEVLHTVLNYMYYDGDRFSVHKELQ